MTQMSGVGTRFEVGHEFEPFVRDSGFPYWNRYAAVNDEFIDIHMDDEAGRSAGYPTAFGMGNLTWAYFHVALHGWLGEECRVVSLSTQFRAAVIRGTQVVVRGTVSEIRIDGEETILEIDIRAEDANGNRLAPARAVIALVQAL
jgi:acyl dehydratase